MDGKSKICTCLRAGVRYKVDDPNEKVIETVAIAQFLAQLLRVISKGLTDHKTSYSNLVVWIRSVEYLGPCT